MAVDVEIAENDPGRGIADGWLRRPLESAIAVSQEHIHQTAVNRGPTSDNIGKAVAVHVAQGDISDDMSSGDRQAITLLTADGGEGTLRPATYPTQTWFRLR
jgi:hypothetical protein